MIPLTCNAVASYAASSTISSPTGAGIATTTTGSGATKTGSASGNAGATSAAEKMEVGFAGAMTLVMAGLLNVF